MHKAFQNLEALVSINYDILSSLTSKTDWLRFEVKTNGIVSFSDELLILLPRPIFIPDGKLNCG